MDKPRRVTLADVAREAKVHVTTVSLALRDNPRIPEATRTRLRELAERMGYRPDPLLSALSTYRTRSKSPRYQATLAYLTNWSTEWGWKDAMGHGEFFSGAEKAAAELGFQLEHFWMKSPSFTEVHMSRILHTRGINGVILASHGREMNEVIRLDWADFSCIKIDYFPRQPAVHNITNNQSGMVRAAMRRLRKMGYRRVGLVMHRGWDHAADCNWTAGYLCEQQQIPPAHRIPAFIYPGPKPVERWMLEDSSTIVPDAEEFAGWLRRHKPEAVLSNGMFARPLFEKLGIRVPEDLAFVDLFLADFSGATAGMRQNYETVGDLAVRIIAGEIGHHRRGIPLIPTTTFVDGTWFDGASCPPRW